MSGIYLHIPYCKMRCIYCDYYKETNESDIDQFVAAVTREAAVRADELNGEPIETIYFGGGTPSRLNKNHFDQIFNTLYAHYNITPDAEITIEANPDDLTATYLQMLQSQPINRLSIGIQSFDDEELKFLSRRHTGAEAIQSVAAAQAAGFNNISIDLMYGLPHLTLDGWKRNLDQAMQLDVQHISAYHLIYEPDTHLYTLLQRGRVRPLEDELSLAMFDLLIDTLAANGFEYYETSNFARHQLYSRHNTSYWSNKKYIGLGPSAHSYDGQRRSWNVANNTRYIAGVNSDQRDYAFETLTESERYNEFVLTGIRTRWGVNLLQLKELFGETYHNYCLQNVQSHIDSGMVEIKENHLLLTRRGLFMTDGIASDLMFV